MRHHRCWPLANHPRLVLRDNVVVQCTGAAPFLQLCDRCSALCCAGRGTGAMPRLFAACRSQGRGQEHAGADGVQQAGFGEPSLRISSAPAPLTLCAFARRLRCTRDRRGPNPKPLIRLQPLYRPLCARLRPVVYLLPHLRALHPARQGVIRVLITKELEAPEVKDQFAKMLAAAVKYAPLHSTSRAAHTAPSRPALPRTSLHLSPLPRGLRQPRSGSAACDRPPAATARDAIRAAQRMAPSPGETFSMRCPKLRWTTSVTAASLRCWSSMALIS